MRRTIRRSWSRCQPSCSRTWTGAAHARGESRGRYITRILRCAVRARHRDDITRRLDELFADPVHQSAGTALRRLGQPLAGVGAQTRSQRILERAVAEHPDWTPAWQTLASTYMNKANAVEELGQLRASIGFYDLSFEVRDRLAAGGDPLMRARSAKVRVLRATTLRDLGDEATAVAEVRAGLAVLEAQGDVLTHPDFANLVSGAQEAFSLAKPSWRAATGARLTRGPFRRSRERIHKHDMRLTVRGRNP